MLTGSHDFPAEMLFVEPTMITWMLPLIEIAQLPFNHFLI